MSRRRSRPPQRRGEFQRTLGPQLRDRVGKGRVIRTLPAAGTRTSKRVRLVISKGHRKGRAAPSRRVRAAAVVGTPGYLCPLLVDLAAGDGRALQAG